MNTTLIKSTKDYSIFKLIDFNRDVDPLHVNKLKKDISNPKSNYLSSHPILVNLEFEVIDGQHRLQAAKELGVEIYYLQEDIKSDQIIYLNSNQKCMSLKDYIKFYKVKDKNINYIQIEKYILKTGISARAIIGLLFGFQGSRLTIAFREGTFKLPPNSIQNDLIIDFFMRFLDFVKNKKIKPTAMFKSTYFVQALNRLYTHPVFQEEVFFRKLEERWYEMAPKGSQNEWMKCLSGIYNYKNSLHRIEFTTEDLLE